MSSSRQIALLKVLAAAAWADGRLETTEINRIKELMLAYRLDDAAVGEIDALLGAPVSYDRCEALTRDLMNHLKSPGDRDAALEEIETLLAADGRVDPEERELLESLRGIMDAMTTVDGLINRITGIFRRTVTGRRDRAASTGALSEFLKNAVLHRLHDLSSGTWSQSVDARALNYATLFGAVLGRVAAAEGNISASELQRIRELLASRFGLAGELLEWTVQSVQEASTGAMDRQGLVSEFNRVADFDQRRELLDAAFSVAGADGTLDSEEMEELRLLANFLWLDPRDYNAVRVAWERRLTAN